MAKGISNTGMVWVAIDVAKRFHQVVVQTPGGRVRRFRVQQNKIYSRQTKPDELHVVLLGRP